VLFRLKSGVAIAAGSDTGPDIAPDFEISTGAIPIDFQLLPVAGARSSAPSINRILSHAHISQTESSIVPANMVSISLRLHMQPVPLTSPIVVIEEQINDVYLSV
jgi:hypothetical protein